MEDKKRPRVGVGVIVIKDDKILLGKRLGSHGEGSWSFPGGHLEFGENVIDCALRELNEEVGIRVKNIRIAPYTNDFFDVENKHYITLFVIADYDSGDVERKEPDKCEGWEWFDWEELPIELFIPIKNLKKLNFNPISFGVDESVAKLGLNEYQEACKRTSKKFASPETEIATWGLGIAGEAGDVASCIKKTFAHKNDSVKDGIKENIGDMMWYAAMICNFFGWGLEDCLQGNVNKLKVRYPDGFSFGNAQRGGTMIKWSGFEEDKKYEEEDGKKD